MFYKEIFAMKFGVSKTVITPPFPTKLACTGNFTDNFTCVHDDVYARCLVMNDGTNYAVFVCLDLLFHSRDLNEAVAEYAKDKYNTEKSAVTVTCTHAHTAPAVKGYNPGHHNDEYEEFLLCRIKECMDYAFSSMFEGTLEYGSKEISLNVYRRKEVDGKILSLPNPEAEHDKELFVMVIKDLSGCVRSVFMNYASHPVFYPELTTISGEFPAKTCSILDEKFGNCISMYCQSACGDVRPSATVKKDAEKGLIWNRTLGFDDMNKYAQNLADEVVSLINGGKLKTTEMCISSTEFSLCLEMEKLPFEYFENLYDRYKSLPDNPVTTNCKNIIEGYYDVMPEELMLYCSVIKLSEGLYIATMGGEPCYNVKKAVISAFEGKDVCFIGYTDCCAYIVDDVLLDEGGYEPESFSEYGLAGPFRKGLNKVYYEGFSKAFGVVNK